MTQGPAGPWSALLHPFSWVYGSLSARQIRRKQQRSVRVDVPVISVGNLAAGGTGKSPFVRLLVGWLIDAGHRPAIAMRGYGAANPHEADEVLEHRSAMPDVPVLAGPDRAFEIQKAQREGIRFDCVVLDDGFQHTELARDLDVVLVDGMRPPARTTTLPAGWLREPASGLRRADVWVVSGPMGQEDQMATAQLAGQPALAEVSAIWQGVHTPQGDEVSVQGKRCVVMAGIARPERVRDALVQAGGIVAAMPPLADHDPISPVMLDQFRALCSEADALVLTAKDAARLGDRLQPWPVPVWIPRVELTVSDGEVALRERVLSVLQ